MQRARGCHPVPGEGEGRAGPGGGSGQGFTTSGWGPLAPWPLHLPPWGWLGYWEEPGRTAGRGRLLGRSLPHKGPRDCPALSSKGLEGRGTAAPRVTEGGPPGWSSPAASPEWAGDLELGWGVGRAQGGDPERRLPLGPANCSTCSAPQVTFHRSDEARLCQAGTALRPLPPQGGRPLQMPLQRVLPSPGAAGQGWPEGKGWGGDLVQKAQENRRFRLGWASAHPGPPSRSGSWGCRPRCGLWPISTLPGLRNGGSSDPPGTSGQGSDPASLGCGTNTHLARLLCPRPLTRDSCWAPGHSVGGHCC